MIRLTWVADNGTINPFHINAKDVEYVGHRTLQEPNSTCIRMYSGKEYLTVMEQKDVVHIVERSLTNDSI